MPAGYFSKHLFSPPQIREEPDAGLGIIVTIPCYREPQLLRTLDSLKRCAPPACAVEVIVHLNSPEGASPDALEENAKTAVAFNEGNNDHSPFTFYLIHSPALPSRHAGVGLARKIVMDEAAFRFMQVRNPRGVIVCLDADCETDENYLAEIQSHFMKNEKSNGCSVYFEHPVEGGEFSPGVYEAILSYELFLRYYIRSLAYCGFPFPYHTVGSSMAVRADAYMKQGGMNRKKAGEDFYFLHKLFPLGQFTELNTTRVIPSPRISDRVPFGTGAAVSKFLDGNSDTRTTYNFQSFADLKKFFHYVPGYYSTEEIPEEALSKALQAFLHQNGFKQALTEIRDHTAGERAFVKRFFRWFDGFRVLKFVHFARDNYYPDEEISGCIAELFRELKLEPASTKKDLLFQLRLMERQPLPTGPLQVF